MLAAVQPLTNHQNSWVYNLAKMYLKVDIIQSKFSKRNSQALCWKFINSNNKYLLWDLLTFTVILLNSKQWFPLVNEDLEQHCVNNGQPPLPPLWKELVIWAYVWWAMCRGNEISRLGYSSITENLLCEKHYENKISMRKVTEQSKVGIQITFIR